MLVLERELEGGSVLDTEGDDDVVTVTHDDAEEVTVTVAVLVPPLDVEGETVALDDMIPVELLELLPLAVLRFVGTVEPEALPVG